jgi:uncharacterized metal-binding protein YceD (DUF177 family)
VKEFNIAYKGLADGLHRYQWTLDDRFFAAFEGSEIHGGEVNVTLELEKSAAGLKLSFAMDGRVRVECDRCAEECEMPVEWEGGFRVRFGDEKVDFDGELMWLGHGEGEFGVAQYLYESVLLALPLKRTHADCAPAGVRFISEEEFERAERGSEMQKMADNPEWQKLKELKDKL